jgi:hypothetical protein
MQSANGRRGASANRKRSPSTSFTNLQQFRPGTMDTAEYSLGLSAGRLILRGLARFFFDRNLIRAGRLFCFYFVTARISHRSMTIALQAAAKIQAFSGAERSK